MTILYFTATGNSLYVAKSLSDKVLSIPQLIKDERYEFEDDKIGIVFPLYSWSIPKYVENYLRKVSIKADYVFMISTYGIFNAGVIHHIDSVAKDVGLKVHYINTIKMVDNYLPGFVMDKQVKNQHKKQIETKIQEIKKDISEQRSYIPKVSNVRKKMTEYMVRHPHNGIESSYYVNNNCTKCGTCAKVCPVANIEIAKENIELKNKCISCYACIQNCPFNAIHLKNERDSSRYRNEHVKLKEIINSNIQV